MSKLTKIIFTLCLFFTCIQGYSADEPHVENLPPAMPEELQSFPKEITPNYEFAFAKMILTLVGLLILVFVTYWLFKRMAGGRLSAMNFNRSIKVLEKRPLSSKSILYLVETEGKKILIAESQLEIRSLGVVEDTSELND